MTIVHVDIVHTIATTPAWPTPHVVETTRTVTNVIDGGPCLTPRTIVCGDTKTVVACGTIRPAESQCDACQTTIVPTVTGVRYHGPHALMIDQDGWLVELIKGDPDDV